MKNIITAALFSLFASSAMAQTTSFYPIPTQIPSGATTPSGLSLKKVSVVGDCDAKVKITVTASDNRAAGAGPVDVMLWGNFAKQTFSIPARSTSALGDERTKTFDGDTLLCGFVKNAYRALDVYVGFGNTGAMRSTIFSTSISDTNTVPEPYRTEMSAPPTGANLVSIRHEARCNKTGTLVLSFGLFNFAQKSLGYVHSNAFGGIKEITLPASMLVNATHTLSIPTTQTLKCDADGIPTNPELHLGASVLFGNTQRKDTNVKKGLTALGANVTLPK
jgi:hypothetical protein